MAHTAARADYVFSTIHSAKGMEWDRVQIWDTSLASLAAFHFIEVAKADRFQPAAHLARYSRRR